MMEPNEVVAAAVMKIVGTSVVLLIFQ